MIEEGFSEYARYIGFVVLFFVGCYMLGAIGEAFSKEKDKEETPRIVRGIVYVGIVLVCLPAIHIGIAIIFGIVYLWRLIF